jgi:ABC-type multidrug transport system fused ATPase/permease subunit
MDTATIAREAPWMVPLLLVLLVATVGSVVGLVVWIVNTILREAKSAGNQFRSDVTARLTKQDEALAVQSTILGAIKELLQAEVGKLRNRLWTHDLRLTRLEDHAGLGGGPQQRRYDDQESGD